MVDEVLTENLVHHVDPTHTEHLERHAHGESLIVC